jgi:Ca2+-transporting ATPase
MRLSAGCLALVPTLSWLNLLKAGAVTISFLTLTFAQLYHVGNMRNASASFLDNDVTRNPNIWPALLLCAALLVGSVYLPVVLAVLELEPPRTAGWALVLVLALFPLLAGEAARWFTLGGLTRADDTREP